ncbi:HNH endonuclease [Gracilimonas sp.]|uniref:HNH endonuclease n=1 Tax=Gracilimonas sp. TaxID=1974203 RepID=UPI0032EE1D03
MNGQVPVLAEPLFNLNSDSSHNWDEKTKGRAPHKPFLILSILDGISEGWIDSPEIDPNQELANHFFEYWDRIMGTDRTTTVALPFFHMNSEPFWNLKYKSGEKPFTYSPSWGAVKERIAYAEINEDLFNLVVNAEERNKIRNKLFETYFSDEAAVEINKISNTNSEVYSYSEKILSLAAGPFIKNHAEHNKAYHRNVRQQIRKDGFSKAIRKNYADICAVCRDKVITPGGKTLVEGAHIIPWSESRNDDPRNGLSLCPTHHWLFDQFMITIRDDFSVRVSKWLKKEETKIRDLATLKNTTLHLPIDEKLHPAHDALTYHNEQFEKAHKEWK